MCNNLTSRLREPIKIFGNVLKTLVKAINSINLTNIINFFGINQDYPPFPPRQNVAKIFIINYVINIK